MSINPPLSPRETAARGRRLDEIEAEARRIIARIVRAHEEKETRHV